MGVLTLINQALLGEATGVTVWEGTLLPASLEGCLQGFSPLQSP